MRSGVVLAGGRSTRFGSTDKAVALLSGTPMICRVVRRLARVVDDLIINARDDQVSSISEVLEDEGLTASFAVDPIPDRGPMAGMMTGLRAASGQYAAVVACDMPFVDPGFIEYLFDRAAGHEAAIPQLDDQWYQTTQAVYRVEPMVAACEDALHRGEGRIMEAVTAIEYVVVTEEDIRGRWNPTTFENINSWDDYVAAKERLGER